MKWLALAVVLSLSGCATTQSNRALGDFSKAMFAVGNEPQRYEVTHRYR